MRTPDEDAWVTQKAAEEDGALVLAGHMRRKPGKFDAGTEVRAIARERVGRVPPRRVMTPKIKKRPKHKAAEVD